MILLLEKKFRLSKIQIVLILLFICILYSFSGCTKSFTFPSGDSFSLTTNISKTTVSVGEEVNVEGIFKNLTNSTYTLNSSASFSDSGLIHINVYNINEEEMIMVGVTRIVELKANAEIIENNKFKLDKPGEYNLLYVFL